MDDLKGMKTSALVVAAGLSSRMGDFKPLLPFNGRTVIETVIDRILRHTNEQIVVVTGYNSDKLSSVLNASYGNRVKLAKNNNYGSSEMFDSIKLGLAELPVSDAFFFQPADMPMIGDETFSLILSSFDPKFSVIAPSYEMRMRHPLLINSSFISKIESYSGSDGLRGLLREHRHDIKYVNISDRGAGIDLDTKEDYLRCLENIDKIKSKEANNG